jgi:hypothetical protein
MIDRICKRIMFRGGFAHGRGRRQDLQFQRAAVPLEASRDTELSANDDAAHNLQRS